MKILKQSTTQVIQFGPFVDKTTGVDLETGLATAMDDATTGIRVSKDGAVFVDRSDSTVPSYDAMGCYRITLNATDTATLGILRIIFEEAATTLPVWDDYLVVTANAYDTLCSTDKWDVNVTEWLGTAPATPTTNGIPEVDVNMWNGVALATTNPLPTVAAGAAGGLPDDTDANGRVRIVDGTGAGELDTASGAVTVGSIAANAITAASINASALDNKGNWNINKTGYSLTVGTGLGNQTSNITGTIDTVTNLTNAATSGDLTATMKTSVTTAASSSTPAVTVSDKTGFSLSTAGILAIWDQLTSALTTASTIGKLLVDNINATISSAATATGFATNTKQDSMETTLNAAATSAALATAQTDLDTLTDARGEPAQGAPAVSTTTNEKVDWLYKAWRNQSWQTSTTYSLYNDAADTVDSKATVSDDGTTAKKGEVVTGP